MKKEILYRHIDWVVFDKLIESICNQIRHSRIQYDVIVPIARGGLVPGRFISEQIDVKDVFCITASFYNSENKRNKDVVIKNKTHCLHDLMDKRVLIVDDISDTGITFNVIKKYLKNYGFPKQISTASLCYKEKSKTKPDFYGETVPNNTWVIFPWEKKNE